MFKYGNDNKLIIECLENIDKDLLSLFSWNVVIGQHTQEKEKSIYQQHFLLYN